MFLILDAYGIPAEIVNTIKVMYTNTSEVVITPDKKIHHQNWSSTGRPSRSFFVQYLLGLCSTQAMDLPLKRRTSSPVTQPKLFQT